MISKAKKPRYRLGAEQITAKIELKKQDRTKRNALLPPRFCVYCKQQIDISVKSYPVKKYCSDECRRQHLHKQYAAANKCWNLPTPTIGALSELKVSVDLLSKGFAVFRALSASCPCDLAVLIDSKLLRIEVTTASRTPRGNISFPQHNKANYDILALVLGDTIIYNPLLPDIS
jgi:hypothetical protein